MSAWLLMGLPGAVYLSGLNQLWLPIGLCIGAYVNWRVVAPRLRIYTEVANDSLTIPSYLDNRFRDNSGVIRMLSALATLLFFAFYTASGLVAGAILLSTTFAMDYYSALLLGTAIIVSYTFVGGFLAVSWTDFFQGTFMFICLLLVPFLAVSELGGIKSTMDIIIAKNSVALNWTEGLTILSVVNLLSWGFGYFGQPHILVRFMAVKNLAAIPIARRICMFWMTLSLLGAVLTGMIGIAYFSDYPMRDPESVFIHFSHILFTPAMAGFILAAILSSIMCALDSQMLASSSALTEDIYHAFLRKKASQKELMWVGRIAVCIISLVAVLMASKEGSRVLDLVGFAWAGLASSFAAPVVVSLFWPRMTRMGAIAGIVTGMLTVIIWHFYVAPNLSFTLYEIIPGILLSLLAVFVGSKMTVADPDQQLEFRRVQELCQAKG
jgi:sodium/proline symporter